MKGVELAALCAILFITIPLLMAWCVLQYAKTHKFRIEPVDDVESGSIDQTLPGYSQPPPDYQSLPPPIYSEKPPSYESIHKETKPFPITV